MKTLQDVIEEMRSFVEAEVEPDLDQIEKWANEMQAYKDATS